MLAENLVVFRIACTVPVQRIVLNRERYAPPAASPFFDSASEAASPGFDHIGPLLNKCYAVPAINCVAVAIVGGQRILLDEFLR